MSDSARARPKHLVLATALLAGCASSASIDPIEGRTFIVEERTRREVWNAAVAALEASGGVERSDFDRGEVRGYAGAGLGYSAVLVSMNQLYPGEDTYTVSVATDAGSPLSDARQAQDALVAAMLTNLNM